MENASNALIMAGSVLLALIILSALVILFQNIGILPNMESKTKLSEQVLAFNQEYETYARGKNVKTDWMYGSEVASVINKAISENGKYAGDDLTLNRIDIVVVIQHGSSEQITIDFPGAPPYKVIGDGLASGTYTFTAGDKGKYNDLINNKSGHVFRGFKNSRGFLCYEIEYHAETGKVKKMIFREATKEILANGFLIRD